MTATARAIARLRSLATPPVVGEKCELCAAPVADEHPHLCDVAARRILCSCGACAILFADRAAPATGTLRRVPTETSALALAIDDATWAALGVPIGLAFFLRATPVGRVVAVYPSPAGPIESLPDEAAWSALCAAHPALDEIAPDIEALLVTRLGEPRAFRAPIDACYRLVGLVRSQRALGDRRALGRLVDEFLDGILEQRRV